MNTLTTVFNSLQSAPVHFTAIHLGLNHLYHPDRIDSALAVLMRLGLLCMDSGGNYWIRPTALHYKKKGSCITIQATDGRSDPGPGQGGVGGPSPYFGSGRDLAPNPLSISGLFS
jgi:hypothetical protein